MQLLINIAAKFLEESIELKNVVSKKIVGLKLQSITLFSAALCLYFWQLP
jgi:hypothetical protein